MSYPSSVKTIGFLAIASVALLIRLTFIFQWDALPYGPHPISDSQTYDQWAQAIAGGQLLRPPAFYYSPLYPYLAAALFSLFGHDLLAISLCNAALGALTVLVIGTTAFELFGLEAGLMTGFLAAFYRPFIFYAAPVAKEPLELLMLALFLLYAVRAAKRNDPRDFAVSGAALGLCALTRGNILAIVPMVLLGAFIKARGKPGSSTVRNSAVFLALMCLSIFPATLHNYLVSGRLIPITYNDGFNLYIGNSEHAHAAHVPDQLSATPGNEEQTTTEVATRDLGHDANPAEVSAYWRNKAIGFMVHEPANEWRLLTEKGRAFWNAAETYDVYDVDFIRKNFDTVLSLPLVTFWMIVVLAAFGAAVTWRDYRETVATLMGFILAYMTSALLFYVTERYRLPALIFLLPLAGAALPLGWKRVQTRSYRLLATAAAFGLLAALLCFSPFPDSVDPTGYDWATLSKIYMDEGKDADAHRALNKALAISPKSLDPGSFVIQAFADHSRAEDEEADRLLQLAIETYPENDVVQYNYAEFKSEKGDPAAALTAIRKAVELSPTSPLNYYGEAVILRQRGDVAEARKAVQKGLEIAPSDPQMTELQKELAEGN